eukprot:9493362-Pyramimonas_sp.AAC.1
MGRRVTFAGVVSDMPAPSLARPSMGFRRWAIIWLGSDAPVEGVAWPVCQQPMNGWTHQIPQISPLPSPDPPWLFPFLFSLLQCSGMHLDCDASIQRSYLNNKMGTKSIRAGPDSPSSFSSSRLRLLPLAIFVFPAL